MISVGRFFFLAIACILCICCDVGIKRYVFFQVSPLQGVSIFQNWLGVDFSLEYVKNTGAAWGVFSSLQAYLLWGRCGIIVALLGSLFFSKAPFGRKIAVSSIAAGAIGNVLDYFIYGHVVDMFHFCFWGYSFAVFNVADSMIFCGVVVLFLQQAKEQRSKNRADRSRA